MQATGVVERGQDAIALRCLHDNENEKGNVDTPLPRPHVRLLTTYSSGTTCTWLSAMPLEITSEVTRLLKEIDVHSRHHQPSPRLYQLFDQGSLHGYARAWRAGNGDDGALDGSYHGHMHDSIPVLSVASEAKSVNNSTVHGCNLLNLYYSTIQVWLMIRRLLVQVQTCATGIAAGGTASVPARWQAGSCAGHAAVHSAMRAAS